MIVLCFYENVYLFLLPVSAGNVYITTCCFISLVLNGKHISNNTTIQGRQTKCL